MTRYSLRALLFCAAGIAAAVPGVGAEGWEAQIQAAEEKHRAAFLARDLPALEAMFSDEFVVNSPLNTIVGKSQLLSMVRNGALTLSEFTQAIEATRRFGDVVFVMGADTVVYAAPSPLAGKTHRRRFTDVWRLEGGNWKFIARQATLLCP
jgi:ketosteroid isomerase-like protein